MIAIVDYGMGNLRSAQKGLERAGQPAIITHDPAVIGEADAVVLPGVGAFKDCYEGLCEKELDQPVIAAARSGKPFLGICVGLQLLFEFGEEGEGSPGLGIFPGRVVRFSPARETGLKVPHMGWNQVRPSGHGAGPLVEALRECPYTYFVHSYYAQPADPDLVLATCHYGIDFPAMVGRDNVFAVQFHPEKSQQAGIRLLEAFGRLAAGVEV
ncbi:MAG: imidazole glycerol phosphate synthase subunit HisH [Candidatus Hydrogenedentes bacterium]|nr:imidazole glycerol phosphate synthase subunit HisH [Candidatus Hydrogenedentota bacterium]